MGRVLLDTNFIFSYLKHSDNNFTNAHKLFKEFDDPEFIIPLIVIAELLVSGELLDFIKFCKNLTHRFTQANENDLKFIATLPLKLRKQLKANDCIILSLCIRKNARLITFDKKLEKIYNTLVSNSYNKDRDIKLI